MIAAAVVPLSILVLIPFFSNLPSFLLYSPIAILLPSPRLSYSVLQMTFTDSALRYCIWSTVGTCICTWMQTPTAFLRRAWTVSMRMSTNQSLQDFTNTSGASRTMFIAGFCTKIGVVLCNALKQKPEIHPEQNEIPWVTNRFSSAYTSCHQTTDKNKATLIMHDWALLLHCLPPHHPVFLSMSRHESRQHCVLNALLRRWVITPRRNIYLVTAPWLKEKFLRFEILLPSLMSSKPLWW